MHLWERVYSFLVVSFAGSEREPVLDGQKSLPMSDYLLIVYGNMLLNNLSRLLNKRLRKEDKMQKAWMYQRFNRRVFLAVLFFLLSSRKNYVAGELNNTKCYWCWIGAVTNNSITIKAKLNNQVQKGQNYLQVFYSKNSDLSTEAGITKVEASSLTHQIATFNLVDLEENTLYYYVIIADGRRYPRRENLQFKTVKVNKQYSFAVGCSACAGGTIEKFISKGVSNSQVFEIIREYQEPDENGKNSPLALFIHMGDLHYRNDLPGLGLKEKNLDDYRKNYHLVMTQERQRNLYQNIPLAYIWDDHDYGTNNADGTYPLKELASQAYREQVPHYPLGESQEIGAIYQSFVIGRVRFVMTDNRFYKDSLQQEKDKPVKSLLGTKQKEWFFRQLMVGKINQEANKEGLIIWVNSLPWIGGGKSFETEEAWDKYPEEREEIANFIQENQINKLLMLSGDAHMLAIDDGQKGTVNSYATNGGGSFPVIQVAALDSRGSVKGGPYNGAKYMIEPKEEELKTGAIAGSKQWGLLNFVDHGTKIEVQIELKRKNETKFECNLSF